MLILNEVKVLCFDTLLQLLILKVVKAAVLVLSRPFARGALGKQEFPPRRVNWDCLRTGELTVYAAGRSGIGAEVRRGTLANGERNGSVCDDHGLLY